MSLEQADAIVRSLDALPADTEALVRRQARDHLIDLAGQHDAKALRVLGRRVLDVVAPEVGEAQEAALLAREEARAAATAALTMVDDGEGRCHGRFTIPSATGAMLRRHLLALANPARHDIEDLTDPATGTWRPTPERLGAALVEYIERYPAERTPDAGGVAATVVVTMTLESLMGGLGAASLDDGLRLSAGEARRLACEAGIVPAVLGSASQPLDLGRKVRLHTAAQRIALGLRDGGCTAQGCEVPPAACHAHHDRPWSHAGATTVDDGRLLCPHHHRLAHRPDYAMQIHADNSVTFHRRT